MLNLKVAFPPRGAAFPCSFMIVVLALTSMMAASVRADYSVTITRGNVSVDIAGVFVQGVPLPKINGTSFFAMIPVFRASLEGMNASIISAALLDAIRAKTPTASVTGVKLTADSNGTLVHYDLSFDLENLSTFANGQERMDLTWRSFAIAGDVGAVGVSINRLVPNYLQPTILTQVQVTGSRTGIQEVKSWYLDNRFTLAAEVPQKTAGLTLFNFSSLALPLGQWSTQRDFSNSRVTLESSSGFNLTFVDRVTEGEDTFYVSSDAVNELKVRIKSPLPLQINDNVLVFDLGQADWKPQLMLASIGGSLAVLIGAYVVERRIQPPFGRARRR